MKPNPRREEILAWMASTGRGYKAAAKHFGESADTIKSWGRPPKVAASRAPARPRTHEPEPPPPAEEDGPADIDLTAADAVTYWRDRLTVALRAVRVALEAKHAGVAKDWERIAAEHRGRLDLALSAHRTIMERAERAAVRDPRELARRAIAGLPRLLEVADDRTLADEVIAAVQRWQAAKAAGGT